MDERARDAAFLFDKLAWLNQNDPLLASRLDLTRVGVFGHSIGGSAAGEAARLDARFQAVANLDGLAGGLPFYVEPNRQAIQQPFLYLGKPLPKGMSAERRAKHDEVMRSVKAGSFRVLIDGATHASFSDDPFWTPGSGAAKARILAVARAYLLEFFLRQLLNRPTELFDGPSPTYPEASVEVFSPTPR